MLRTSILVSVHIFFHSHIDANIQYTFSLPHQIINDRPLNLNNYEKSFITALSSIFKVFVFPKVEEIN